MKTFHGETTAPKFFYPQQNIVMHPQEKEKLLEALGKASPPGYRSGPAESAPTKSGQDQEPVSERLVTESSAKPILDEHPVSRRKGP